MRSVSVSNLPGEENFGFEKDEELPNSPLVNNWVYIKIGGTKKNEILIFIHTLVICMMKLYRIGIFIYFQNIVE